MKASLKTTSATPAFVLEVLRDNHRHQCAFDPEAEPGAFLTVRALLLRAGAPGSALKPSAPMAEMARQFPAVFLGPIARLAPGRLPTVAIKTPWYTAAVSVMSLGILGTAAGYVIAPTVVGWSLTVVAIGWIATWGAARLRPVAVQFGAIKTFRDLAEAISSKPTA